MAHQRYRWIPFVGVLVLCMGMVACDSWDDHTDPGPDEFRVAAKVYNQDTNYGVINAQVWFDIVGDSNEEPLITDSNGWTPVFKLRLRDDQPEPTEVHVTVRGGPDYGLFDETVVLSLEFSPREGEHVWTALVGLKAKVGGV